MADGDREILEKAAKAAGLQVRHVLVNGDLDVGADRAPWNPLKDDGDALRLAVTCGLGLDIWRGIVDSTIPHVEVRAYIYRRWMLAERADDNGASLQAAVRRAIVRTAAKIWEANHG